VTLLDIYAALGSPSVLAISNRTETPGCLVEQAVMRLLAKHSKMRRPCCLSRLGQVTLAKLSADFHLRLVKHRGPQDLETIHA